MRLLSHRPTVSPSLSPEWRETDPFLGESKLSRHFSRQNGERKSLGWRLPGYPAELRAPMAGLFGTSFRKRPIPPLLMPIWREDVAAEAIVNAVAHRDHNSNGSVQVMLFTDRLEVWNPGTLTNAEILEAFALRDRRRLRETTIDPALAEGLVERTNPDKPTSRLQQYRLTDKGRTLLKQANQEKG